MIWEIVRHILRAVFIAVAFLSLFHLIPFSTDGDIDEAELELFTDPNTTLEIVPTPHLTNSSEGILSIDASSESPVAAKENTSQAEKPAVENVVLSHGSDEEKVVANLTEELNEALRRGRDILALGPLLIPANWNIESSDFLKWAAEFFPVTWPRISEKDKFFRVVGISEDAVCTEPPDPLDYTIGWQQRSISYLYQSNKTRIQCGLPNDTDVDSPGLQIIEGPQLQEKLNETVAYKGCTVVFFYSSSCPYCHRAAPFMHAAGVYFPSLQFLAVDTDKSPGIAGHYGIMGVPVAVLFHEKKFITGWTIPYPDARDTIRAFIMAYTDTKYIPVTQNVTGLEEGIMSRFQLKKPNNFFYMLSCIIVIGGFIWMIWQKYLLDQIKRALDRAGVNDDRLVLGVQQPNPQGEIQMPVPDLLQGVI